MAALHGSECPRPDWDGSYLGSIDGRIGNVVKAFPFKMADIRFDKIYRVAIHPTKNAFPCVVDELAPLFGIRKIGTHTVTIKKILYAIYNVGPEAVNLRDYKNPSYNYFFHQYVQDVFVFRLIIGLEFNTESSVIVLDDKPASYRNRYDEPVVLESKISIAMTDRWFDEKGIGSSLERMIPGPDGVSYIRPKIQKVIMRIDPNLIWLDGQMIALINRLM